MSETRQTTADWEPCTPGALGQLVTKLRTKQRVRRVRRATAAATALAVLFVGGYFALFGTATDPVYAGLACSELKQHAVAYLREELDSDLMQRISRHLAACPHCQDRYEQQRQMMQNGQPGQSQIDWSGPACRVSAVEAARRPSRERVSAVVAASGHTSGGTKLSGESLVTRRRSAVAVLYSSWNQVPAG